MIKGRKSSDNGDDNDRERELGIAKSVMLDVNFILLIWGAKLLFISLHFRINVVFCFFFLFCFSLLFLFSTCCCPVIFFLLLHFSCTFRHIQTHSAKTLLFFNEFSSSRFELLEHIFSFLFVYSLISQNDSTASVKFFFLSPFYFVYIEICTQGSSIKYSTQKIHLNAVDLNHSD